MTPKFLLLSLASLAIVSSVQGRCSMFGRCNLDDSYPPPWENCHKETQPETVWNVYLPRDLQAKYMELCPRHSIWSPLCCEHKQLIGLVETLEQKIKPLFGRCPTCYANIADLFCTITCDPNQADFLTGVRNPPGDKFYNKVSVFAKESYAERLYDSCKDVKRSNESTKTVIEEMCPRCYPTDFYMSLISNYPLDANRTFGQIVHNGEETEMKPIEIDVTACCGCADCPASCTTSESTTERPVERISQTATEPAIGTTPSENDADGDDAHDDDHSAGTLNQISFTFVAMTVILPFIMLNQI